MITKNYFSYFDDNYLYDNYFNDIFVVEDDTIVLEEKQLIYSESENINKFVNHRYRNAFESRDFVEGIKEGLFKDKKYVNFILDINKRYAFIENNEVYQLSFYNIDGDNYLAYFKMPETHLIQNVDRSTLERILSTKLRIVGDTFTTIKLPSEDTIENKLKDQKRNFWNFVQGLYSPLELSMPLVDYNLSNNMTNKNIKDNNYEFITDMLCIDKKCNFYKISVTYLGPNDYKLEYKYMALKDYELNNLFNVEMAIDKTTQKKLLKK